MVREFSEEKRQEIFRLLDEIDMRDWKSFMEWCGSRKEEFGDWPDKLSVSAYTRYVDQYHEKVLEINEMTRQQVNTVFENVAEIDARYAARLREHREKVKEQIAIVKTMTEFMDSMSNDIPNKAHRSGGGSNENCARTEEKKKENKEVNLHNHGREEQPPLEVIFFDIYEVEGQGKSILDEAEAQGIIGEPEVAFMNQLVSYIRNSSTESFGCLDGLDALYDKGLISEENYTCLMDIHEQVNGPGDYDVFILKEQACNVYNEIFRVIAERTIVQKYINEDVLRNMLDWDIDALNSYYKKNFVEDLRMAMLEGGIVDEASILYFLATIDVESGATTSGEEIFLEQRSDFTNLLYDENTKGAGPMQITGETQEKFIIYLIDHTEDEEELWRLNQYLINFEKYEVIINGKKGIKCTNPCILDGMSVAEYIAKYYPIQSAVWFWVYNRNSFEINGQALSINECIEQYHREGFDETELLAVSCAVNGSEFGARGRGRFLVSGNEVVRDEQNAKIVLTFIDKTDDMVGTPEYNNNFLYTNEDGYRVYQSTSYLPNGWKERLDSYEGLKEFFQED